MSEKIRLGLRRARRWLPLVLAAALVSLVFGVTTASADLSLGPHEATYQVTTDSTVTVDLGPLGTLEIDSPLPLFLGARVIVHEIPSSVTQVGSARTLEALSSDLQSYLQFFARPQATVAAAASALVVDALWRSAMAFTTLLTVWFALGALLGRVRRTELARAVSVHRRELVAGGAVVLLVLVAGTASGVSRSRTDVDATPTSVFDGTPLQGARVTGRLGGVIDTYGSYAVAAYRQNEAFYAGADRAMVAAWAARAQEIAGTHGDSPAVEAPAKDAPVVMLVVSDLHCNVGMAPLIHDAATLSGANVILNAGDSTMDGTAVEKYCIDTFASAAPKDVPTVVSGGNHDSEETAAQERAAGMVVLSGDVVTVKGVRVLGDSDPNATRVGVGTSAVSESSAQEGQRLADVACGEKDGVDLLLIHTPTVGNQALEQGCVPAQVSGHLHMRYGPLQVGDGIRYISASTAGAVSGQPTVGPLHGTAELTVLRFDPATRGFLDYQVIQVHKDGTATVGYRFTWPSTRGLPGVLSELLAPRPTAVVAPSTGPTTDPGTGAGSAVPTVPAGE
ncbi:MAG TPA: metallophosphoesterase family protein [Cellulomonadaceae bacterium]|nr:metallophosphoesterase family protein [Cellulomonadaceae bacterium]